MIRRVAVLGAGISGLSAAHRLLELRPDLDVVVLDAAERSGGLIRTDWIQGFLVEQGPDSILTEKPQALSLARRLGLEDQLLPTRTTHRGAYVLCRGKLERIPEGFSMMAPSQALPILTSPILSLGGKLRLMLEPLLPRGPHEDDESTARFVERRFGKEVLERLAQPLMSGIYGSSPSELSLQSTMPRFIELERRHRSVTLGLLRQRRNATSEARGVRYGLFVAFKRGNQTLTDALQSELAGRVRLRVRVRSITPNDHGYELHIEGAAEPSLFVDAVIVALPARVSSPLLAPVDSVLAEALGEIRFGSTATVAFGFRRPDIAHPLDAFGFVVPDVEQRRVLASTWASEKFEGRAPEGHALIRVFFGGDRHPEIPSASDDELIRIGREELRDLIGATGEPLFASVGRQLEAMPKYTLGHTRRIERCEARLTHLPRLALAGNSLYGVGIPDAIGAGERAAERILRAFEG